MVSLLWYLQINPFARTQDVGSTPNSFDWAESSVLHDAVWGGHDQVVVARLQFMKE